MIRGYNCLVWWGCWVVWFFVGLEMRQIQKIAIGSQVDARNQSQLTRTNIWLEGQWELGHKITTTPFDELSEAEKFARNQMLQWQRDIQTNNYFQYRMGLLTEEQWGVLGFCIEGHYEAAAQDINTKWKRWKHLLENIYCLYKTNVDNA